MRIEKQTEEYKGSGGCLRKERIVIRHVPRQSNMVTNPKHILYGGMAENAIRVFVVPKLSSGRYQQVLTDDEQAYLEEIMGLEKGSLSIYKKDHNFWDDDNVDGVSRVMLRKQDNFLDLSSPEDYIRYKILLANKDLIAPSLKELEDHPKATYQFVVVGPDDESKKARMTMSTTMMCYKEFGKIEEEKDILMYLVEMLDGRPLSEKTKLEVLQVKINEHIQADPKRVLKLLTDKGLRTKVFIKSCVRESVIKKRGDFYYTDAGVPLCENGQEPVLNVAAEYLDSPKHQELKFKMEEQLHDIKNAK